MKECRNFKVVINGGELTRNINKRSQKFWKPIDVHSVINVVGEIVSSICTWNFVKYLGKHDFSCG